MIVTAPFAAGSDDAVPTVPELFPSSPRIPHDATVNIDKPTRNAISTLLLNLDPAFSIQSSQPPRHSQPKLVQVTEPVDTGQRSVHIPAQWVRADVADGTASSHKCGPVGRLACAGELRLALGLQSEPWRLTMTTDFQIGALNIHTTQEEEWKRQLTEESTFEIKLASPNGAIWTAAGDDLFEALKCARLQIEPLGYLPLCNGARVDAHPSGMLRDTTGGSTLYILKMKRVPRERVFIFDRAEADAVGTVAEPRNYGFAERAQTVITSTPD